MYSPILYSPFYNKSDFKRYIHAGAYHVEARVVALASALLPRRSNGDTNI